MPNIARLSGNERLSVLHALPPVHVASVFPRQLVMLALQTATTAYGDMYRGRYQYLNAFMEDMQSEPEEMK